MPTQSTTYNSRVTDEALEKRFRDTFRSQGGAELVDDLYAQGVIVPVVDFTAAATGQQLAENLQTAWDFSTAHLSQLGPANSSLSTTAGFWKLDVVASTLFTASAQTSNISLTDGITSKIIWEFNTVTTTDAGPQSIIEESFVIFVRSGDSITVSSGAACHLDVSYRQIATVSGDLVNPSGFTSS